MSTPVTYVAMYVLAYLIGSIPFGFILVKLFLKQDIRTTGSGNIGATNVARSGRKGLAVATLLLDAAKGAFAVLLLINFSAQALNNFATQPLNDLIFETKISSYGETWSFAPKAAMAALCAVLGHCFPIWLKFKGGKGVATALGAFLVIAPKAVAVCFVAFIVILVITRYVSLGSIITAALFPILAWWLYPDLRKLAVSLSLTTTSLVIIAKHYQNIQRLAAGTENKFGGKPKGPLEMERDA